MVARRKRRHSVAESPARRLKTWNNQPALEASGANSAPAWGFSSS